MNSKTWGEWAFFFGVLIAVLLAFFPELIDNGASTTTLIILGFLVGFWNITAKEKSLFLVAAIALLTVGVAGLEDLPKIGTTLSSFTASITAFVAPAAFIVALTAIIETGKKSS